MSCKCRDAETPQTAGSERWEGDSEKNKNKKERERQNEGDRWMRFASSSDMKDSS